MQLTSLIGPWLCVLVITANYAVLVRRLFRRGTNAGLASAAFLLTTALVVGCIAIFYLGHFGERYGPAFVTNLQAATTLPDMFRIVLWLAALPEEAIKITPVVLLLVIFPSRLKRRSDPVEMLIYSALGFALCENLIYVTSFSVLPIFKQYGLLLSVGRGVFGCLVHSMLAAVTGFLLARCWHRRSKWFWLIITYGIGVILHASFDTTLFHFVFQAKSAIPVSPVEVGLSAIYFLATAFVLLLLGMLALWRSRRLGRELVSAPASGAS